MPGDGCSGTCQIEPYYDCPTVGAPCVFQVQCGDGVDRLHGGYAGAVDADGAAPSDAVAHGADCSPDGDRADAVDVDGRAAGTFEFDGRDEQ